MAGPVLPTDRPLFQPGFDYEFVECYGDFPQPAPYGIAYATGQSVLVIDKFDTNYNNIVHPNHTAVKIVQLYEKGSIPPQKCYNNYNRAPKGGKVTKFLDGVLNTNIVESLKDSLQINNPILIDALESGLYQIEKEFDDGSKTQVIIQKNNN